MSDRITLEKLERIVYSLNKMTHNKIDFSLEHAYQGWRLVKKGGSVNVSERGSKRETYDFIRCYMDGIELGSVLHVLKNGIANPADNPTPTKYDGSPVDSS